MMGTEKPKGDWLAHEWCFGTYLAVIGGRLLMGPGQAKAWALLFIGCLLVSSAVIAWARDNPTATRWRIRLLIFPVAMGVCFYGMGHALPALGFVSRDGLLLGWDRYLLGETPSVMWASWRCPWLVDLSMAGYLFFFVYLVVGPGLYCLRQLEVFRSCMVGLFVVYGVGFLGYVLMPAGGPHRHLTFEQPLEGIWLLSATLTMVNEGSNKVDAFPSIHLGATLYLLLFDWKHARTRFWWLLVPCLILWFSTMFLRFHYFVDLLAGVVVALLGWYFADIQWRRDVRGSLVPDAAQTRQGSSIAR